MSRKEKLSHKEISERIVAGMGLVYDLFNEMNSLFRMFIDSLQSSDLDLLILKRRFLLPKPKERRLYTVADDYIKRDMGFIAQVGAGGDEDDEPVDLLDDEDLEINRKGIQITPDTQFLAVRAILYDPEAVKDDSFEPYIIGALLSSLNQSPRGKAERKNKFHLKRSGRLFRAMIQLNSTLKKGQEISWVIPKYKLSATVSGIVIRPVVEFDTEEVFNEFIESITNLVENI